MYPHNINEIYENFKLGKFTEQDVINKICEFILENYSVFNLQYYDSDFRSELILYILQKGPSFFLNFNPQNGTFFSYIYGNIKSVVLHLLKKSIENELNYKLAIEHSKEDLFSNKYNTECYEPFHVISERETEYTVTKVNNINGNLSKIINSKNKRCKKLLLTFVLKHSYNLDENLIQKISSICQIDKNELISFIEYINKKLLLKEKKKKNLEEKRNKAYFLKNKYYYQINKLKEDIQKDNIYREESIHKKYEKNYNAWKNTNKLIYKTTSYTIPRNKDIADVLGICERQVNYYIKAIKKLTDDNEQNNQSDEDL